MKLFCSVNSPYARKCRVVLHERNIQGCEEVLVNSLENPPELLAVNPLGKVPALLREGDVPLCDSTVIVEYLDHQGSAAPLLPQDADARIAMQALMVLADGVMDLAVEWVLQTRRPEHLQWPDWIVRRREAILRTLASIEGHPLLHAPQINMAQVNVGCALAYLEFRHPSLRWRDANPVLATFLDAFNTRPSMRVTEPKA